MSERTAAGQRCWKSVRSRIAASKASWPAFTVPNTTWFLSTRFRMMTSVSTSIGAFRPGTPVNTKTPLVPITSITWKAMDEAPVAS